MINLLLFIRCYRRCLPLSKIHTLAIFLPAWGCGLSISQQPLRDSGFLLLAPCTILTFCMNVSERNETPQRFQALFPPKLHLQRSFAKSCFQAFGPHASWPRLLKPPLIPPPFPILLYPPINLINSSRARVDGAERPLRHCRLRPRAVTGFSFSWAFRAAGSLRFRPSYRI